MMRAHGIASNAASNKPAATRVAKSEEQDSNAATPKKRKANQFLLEHAADDEEAISWGSSNTLKIKEDPCEEKYNFKTEGGAAGEDIKPQIMRDQGQLNLEQAVNLMQYYDNDSQVAVDDLYGAGEYGGGISGYGTSSAYDTSMGSAYDFDEHIRTTYDPVDSINGGIHQMRQLGYFGGMNKSSSVPRSSQQTFQYKQHGLLFQAEDQGHSDCPLIVE
jgi:hypothetical protein